MTDKIVARYKGETTGAYIIGVPARDLTERDWARLPDALKDKAINTGLYEKPSGYTPPSKPTPEELEEPEENDQ